MDPCPTCSSGAWNTELKAHQLKLPGPSLISAPAPGPRLHNQPQGQISREGGRKHQRPLVNPPSMPFKALRTDRYPLLRNTPPKRDARDFPGGPVAETSPSNAEGVGLIPGQGAKGFSHSSVGKGSACNAGEPSLIPGSGRSSAEGNGTPLQCSCLENTMDRGAWWAAVPWGCKESGTTEQLTLHRELRPHMPCRSKQKTKKHKAEQYCNELIKTFKTVHIKKNSLKKREMPKKKPTNMHSTEQRTSSSELLSSIGSTPGL